MEDKRHEIPAPMLDAATAAMMALQGTDGCIATQDLAEAALEAADVAKMAADRERIGMALFQNGYDSGWTTDSAVEAIEAMAARIAALEADSRRLRWLMECGAIDGFSGVADGRYDFASQVAIERGHDEPTPDDEFDGWRRLIDAAIKAPSGAGGE